MRSDDGELIAEFRRSLDLLQDAHDTYLAAIEPVRKQLNQERFARILIGPEPDQIAVELNDSYAALIDSGRSGNDSGRPSGGLSMSDALLLRASTWTLGDSNS